MISEGAFSRITFVDYQKVAAGEFFEKRRQRDQSAKRAYRLLLQEPESEADLFMLDIMREEMSNDDPRLQ